MPALGASRSRASPAVARALGKTKSEVVRDALRRHVELERFCGLQRYARAQAERRGIGPEDTERSVDDVRSASV